MLSLKMKKRKELMKNLNCESEVVQPLGLIVYFCLYCFPVVSLHKQTQTDL